MSKRVDIGSRPTTRRGGPPGGDAADAWVDNRNEDEPEARKRLTIDLPASLHRRVKIACVMEETTIVEVVRELLAERFPAQE